MNQYFEDLRTKQYGEAYVATLADLNWREKQRADAILNPSWYDNNPRIIRTENEYQRHMNNINNFGFSVHASNGKTMLEREAEERRHERNINNYGFTVRATQSKPF